MAMTIKGRVEQMTVQLLKNEGLEELQYQDLEVFVADVIGPKNSSSMTAGYARFEVAGERMEWSFSYDEVLYITRGAITIHFDGKSVTGRPGEMIFIEKGTKVVYETAEDGSALVYVSYPDWQATQSDSEFKQLMDRFHPVDEK